MPALELDPATALIVIDLQSGTTANPNARPIEGIIARNVELVTAFRDRALPIVLASVDGTPAGRTQYGAGAREFPAAWSALRPELEPQSSDILITRRTWSAFAGTDLDQRLRELGVTKLVLSGLATSFGVESTARQAYDLGYSVVIAVDAITDPSLDARDASTTRVFPALGVCVATADVIGALSRL